MFDITPIKGGIKNINDFNRINYGDCFITYSNNKFNVISISDTNLSNKLKCSEIKSGNLIIIDTTNNYIKKITNINKSFAIETFNKKINQSFINELLKDSMHRLFNDELTLMINLDNGVFYINAFIFCDLSLNELELYCVVTTDSNINKNDLDIYFKECVFSSFNAIYNGKINYNIFLITNNKNAYDKDAFKIALKMILKRLAINLINIESKIIAYNIIGASNITESIKYAKNITNIGAIQNDILESKFNTNSFISNINDIFYPIKFENIKIYINDFLLYEYGIFNIENTNKIVKLINNENEFRISFDLKNGNDSFCLYMAN